MEFISEKTDVTTVLTTLQNLKFDIDARKLATVIGLNEATLSRKKKTGEDLAPKYLNKIKAKYGVDFLNKKMSKLDNNFVSVIYRPDVYLSAGYGVSVTDEHTEKMVLDVALFITDRGTKINPEHCEIVRVSGNSMADEYKHGDRVIIDKNDKALNDGQIYAFRYDGQPYIKEINRAGKKIKCLSINKEYEPFFIESGVDFEVLGRIIPRVRL